MTENRKVDCVVIPSAEQDSSAEAGTREKQQRIRSMMFERAMVASSSDVLGFLSIADILRVGATSKLYQECTQTEIRTRAIRLTNGTSLAWDSKSADGKYMSADDLTYKEALNVPFRGKNLMHWWKKAAPNSRVEMFEIISQWAGGWPKLLHARENGAKPPPKLVANGSTVQIATLGEDVLPLVFVYDIYCDDKWKWSGLLPLTEGDMGGILIASENDMEEEYGFYLIPHSSKSLGFATDNTTVHDMSHSRRPKNFLLSTRADDQRNWRFNVSMLSPKCSETLVISFDIVPATMVGQLSACRAWKPNNSVSRELLRHVVFDPNVKRAGGFSAAALDDIIGIDGDTGMTKILNDTSFEVCHWHDTRKPKQPMLHLTVDFSAPDRMLEELIVNPPPAPSKDS